ncbi:MAG TPA: serine hydrolase domain-containing protein [Clostridia bacterium]|nr:serine hydrolase domain-containing protein [Clostridia bacterium]
MALTHRSAMTEPAKPAAAMQSLLPAFQEQDARFASAFDLVTEAIANHAFPSAVLAVTHRGQLIIWRAFGRFTYDAGSPHVSPTTVYDLASLTKVVATTSMAMLLFERGLLDIEAPVVAIAPEFAAGSSDPRRKSITVRMLLAHSSGLPAYEQLYNRASTRDTLIASAMTMPLKADPMTHAEYSDIGFIILGELLSRVANESIDRFCSREVFAPLEISSAAFCPPAEWRRHIPPTVDDRDFRMRVVQGEVHDENASVMGGVSGHAGLFASAYDVALFAHCMLAGGAPVVRPATVNMFTRRESLPPGTSHALGWDTPSQPSQSGRHFSPRSYGHLGYTGTSLWCDAERQLSVTLLTNRVWPDRSSQAIKQVRPSVHDAIVEALSQES